MRTEYKVVKPFGCAKRDDIFKTEDGIEYVMESTKGNDKYTNSRYMMITANYVLELLNGGNLKEWGEEIKDETNTEEEYIPFIDTRNSSIPTASYASLLDKILPAPCGAE